MIPKNWKGVTITQYEAVGEIMQPPIKDDLDKIQRYIDVLEILTGEDAEVIRKLPISELLTTNKLLNTKIPNKIPKYIKLKGNMYKVILDIQKEDADRYMMLMNALKSNKTEQIMFSVFKPIKWRWGKEIELDPIESAKRIAHFKELPATIAMPVKVFFCNLSTELTDAILRYSEKRLKEMNKTMEQQTDYLKSLDGKL